MDKTFLKKQKKLPVPIDEEEFSKLIKYTYQEHHKISFLLGYGSGLRVSEVIGLEQRDINLKEKKILIRQGKGRRDRVVPLPKGFREKHLNLIPIKCGSRALQISFRRTCERAGFLKNKPTLRFHSLRHGFGSQLAKKGTPIHHIRTLMGHTNISTTNVYLELNPTEALKSYEELF